MIVTMGAAVTSIGRKNVGTPIASNPGDTGPQGICNRAASARDRQSPAYPNLAAQCGPVRRANIAKGYYYVDGMSPDDPAYRVALTDRGEVIVSQNPTLVAMRQALPESQRRGFTMAQGVRAGMVDPAFPGWVAQGLSRDPELLKGFNDGLVAQAPNDPNLTQALQPQDDAVSGIPRPVLIGGGVAVALGLGLLAFKLTR